MQYDVLLCDADDTLFDFAKAEAAAFDLTCEAMGLPGGPEQLAIYEPINRALWKLLEQGGTTQAELKVKRFAQYLEEIGSDKDARLMADTYAGKLGEQNIPLPGAIEAVERWSRMLPVVIVTNGIAKIQRGRMGSSPIRHFISGMVISEEIGASKPDPKMLFAGMEIAGIADKRRALVLGDSLSSDMSAAANAGIDACWFNPKKLVNTKNLPIRYEIRSLDEVDAILTGERRRDNE